MFTLRFSSKYLILAFVTFGAAASLAGCGDKGASAASPADVNAFNGGNGKMPADFKAKMEAAQRNAQTNAQQAGEAARQKAAQTPPK